MGVSMRLVRPVVGCCSSSISLSSVLPRGSDKNSGPASTDGRRAGVICSASLRTTAAPVSASRVIVTSIGYPATSPALAAAFVRTTFRGSRTSTGSRSTIWWTRSPGVCQCSSTTAAPPTAALATSSRRSSMHSSRAVRASPDLPVRAQQAAAATCRSIADHAGTFYLAARAAGASRRPRRFV